MVKMTLYTYLLIQRPRDGYVEIIGIDDTYQSVTPEVGMKFDYSERGYRDIDHLAPNGTPTQVERAYGFPDINDHSDLSEFWTVLHVFGGGQNLKYSALEHIMGEEGKTRGEIEKVYLQPLIDACLKQGRYEENACQPGSVSDSVYMWRYILEYGYGYYGKDVRIRTLDEQLYPRIPEIGTPDCDKDIIYIFNDDISINYSALAWFSELGNEEEFLQQVVDACFKQGA